MSDLPEETSVEQLASSPKNRKIRAQRKTWKNKLKRKQRRH